MLRHYNLEKVREIAGGDEDFVGIIVATFLQEIPPDLESMQSAIANNNHKMAYQFAHKMKPNLDMFGIDLLGQIKAMEKWSDSNKPTSAIQSKLDDITSTLGTVIAELQEDF
ncbi:Hpt domain-containing protein [uncultured Dokdonia sp.]|jgi:HPt (histidine-containing phosphotransfer) domain-containing protein|uniref:Hpt domain-containing protein n=1 Tax=unclassified Dokdonia TaxID=2615033 RepID=UPI00263345F6|nr:Hpt domain-containing protein [uncultured Dokdonia sp.]|tara:strand:+ start:4816 stop:5151 length:336 start_codon:yes stop_codon:yes gene_type:complete